MNTLHPPTLTFQGGELRLSIPVGSSRRGGGLRSSIRSFTRGSRRRLMSQCARLDWHHYARSVTPIHFLTLTTPEHLWSQGAFVYRALRRFHDWLLMVPGFEGAIVKKELGARRGMLHYHLVVFGPSELKHAAVAAAWARSLRVDAARVDAQIARNGQEVSQYLSKYVAKVGYEGSPKGTGGSAGALATAAPQPPDDEALSKAHNVDVESCAYTGNRWWYLWGDLKEGEINDLGEGAQNLGSRIRRIFRRWRQQAVVKSIVRKFAIEYGESMASHPEVFMHATREAKKQIRWLKGSSGWRIFASPQVIEDCLAAALGACG